MVVTTELTKLHRTVEELRTVLDSVRGRYGDVPAIRRLLGDVERIELDASELDSLNPLADANGPIHLLDDTPLDPSLWADADDEGLGGYNR